MEQIFCQSCGMPMTAPEHYGTEANGSVSHDYCIYCYANGAFTADITMDEMIEHCSQFVDEFNRDSGQRLTREDAIREMNNYFPRLKRWQS